SNLAVSDVETTTSSITFTITTAPTKGTLQKTSDGTSWNNIGLNGTFTQADIDAGYVRYVPNDNQTGSDNFGFSYSDGTATTADQTFNLNITAVNDAPTLNTNNTLTLNEDATTLITNSNLAASDIETAASGITFTVTSTPNKGSLQKTSDGASWSNIGLNGTFTQADIDAGHVRYVPNANQNGSDSFGFSYSDSTASSIDQTFNLNITAVNDAPVLNTNDTLTVDEGTNTVITSSYLGVSDVETAASGITFTVTTEPGKGILQKSSNGTTWSNISLNDTFTQADIDAGHVRYVPNSNQSGSDSFGFSYSDGQTSVEAQNFSINITGSNDAPSLTSNNTLNLNGGEAPFISSSLLTVSDNDTAASDINYTVTSLPTKGSLQKTSDGVNWETISMSGHFTQADINAGHLRYVSDPSQFGSDSFMFNVSDGNTTVSSQRFNFDITAVTASPSPTTTSSSTSAIIVEQSKQISSLFDANLQQTGPTDTAPSLSPVSSTYANLGSVLSGSTTTTAPTAPSFSGGDNAHTTSSIPTLNTNASEGANSRLTEGSAVVIDNKTTQQSSESPTEESDTDNPSAEEPANAEANPTETLPAQTETKSTETEETAAKSEEAAKIPEKTNQSTNTKTKANADTSNAENKSDGKAKK
ncbi:MAG TPA: cadherin-like domain-containing protein, partial [Coxiellaceae bacterium]|nr:cadherin-like domain-containing protein [Coxiellaceae bacterium]